MSEHAILGASGAYRWMNCAGSVEASKGVVPSGGSVYALEGNAAHALAEVCLEHVIDAKELVGNAVELSRDGDLVRITSWEGETMFKGARPRQLAHSFKIDDDMARAVQVFLDDVRDDVAELAGAGTRLFIEERLNLEPLLGRAGMFGTADVVIVQPYGDLVVNDYKHGKGIVVEVEHNEQAMFYALGALAAHGTEFARVRIKITQPRAEHVDGPVREWVTTPTELLAWGQMLLMAAEATDKPNAPLHPGSWCRFCPAKAGMGRDGKPVQCPALKAEIKAVTRYSDNPEAPEGAILPASDDYEQISRALTIIPMLDSWAKDVEGLAQRAMERGIVVPGYKLVRKRANRKWIDAAEVERKLKNRSGVKKADTHTASLKSPAQIEKLVGKDWVARHAEKPEGGLTVATESDKRAAVERKPLKYSALPADTASKPTTEDPCDT